MPSLFGPKVPHELETGPLELNNRSVLKPFRRSAAMMPLVL